MDELTSGPIDTNCCNSLRTGSLHIRCGQSLGDATEMTAVQLCDENVKDALSPKQQKKILNAATKAHARGRWETAQARAAAVLAKLS